MRMHTRVRAIEAHTNTLTRRRRPRRGAAKATTLQPSPSGRTLVANCSQRVGYELAEVRAGERGAQEKRESDLAGDGVGVGADEYIMP
jgi:hypothetical protein